MRSEGAEDERRGGNQLAAFRAARPGTADFFAHTTLGTRRLTWATSDFDAPSVFAIFASEGYGVVSRIGSAFIVLILHRFSILFLCHFLRLNKESAPSSVPPCTARSVPPCVVIRSHPSGVKARAVGAPMAVTRLSLKPGAGHEEPGSPK